MSGIKQTYNPVFEIQCILVTHKIIQKSNLSMNSRKCDKRNLEGLSTGFLI